MLTPLLRQPWWARTFFIAFLVVWEGGLLTTALTSRTSALAPIVLFAVLGAAITWRNYRTGVDVGRDRLVVRNSLRTVRLARSAVVGFRVAQTGPTPVGRVGVDVELADGETRAVDITVQPLFLPGSRARVERDRQVLLSWLNGSGAP